MIPPSEVWSVHFNAIYAWWMVLRLVIHSLIGVSNSKEENKEQSCTQST
jgi:hypothetical protein